MRDEQIGINNESIIYNQNKIKKLDDKILLNTRNISRLLKRIKTLEHRVFPCKECSMSSCDGCPHKEAFY